MEATMPEVGQLVGQRVSVQINSDYSDRPLYKGEGTVNAYLMSQSSSDGCVDVRYAVVVECDDRQLRFCRPNQVKVLARGSQPSGLW